jgi:hypothetical protein
MKFKLGFMYCCSHTHFKIRKMKWPVDRFILCVLDRDCVVSARSVAADQYCEQRGAPMWSHEDVEVEDASPPPSPRYSTLYCLLMEVKCMYGTVARSCVGSLWLILLIFWDVLRFRLNFVVYFLQVWWPIVRIFEFLNWSGKYRGLMHN